MDNLISLMHRFVEAEEQFKSTKNTLRDALACDIDPQDDGYQYLVEKYETTFKNLEETQTQMRSHKDFDESELDEVRIMNRPASEWDPTWNDRD